MVRTGLLQRSNDDAPGHSPPGRLIAGDLSFLIRRCAAVFHDPAKRGIREEHERDPRRIR